MAQKALRFNTPLTVVPAPAWSKHLEEDGVEAPVKRKTRKKPKDDHFGAFRSRQAVAILHEVSGWTTGTSVVYWVEGYDIFDPNDPAASTPKQQRQSKLGWIPVVTTGAHESRATFYPPERVETIIPGKRYYRFGEVYAQSTGGSVLGVVEQGEQVELNDRENEALIRETIIRESL